MGHTFNYKASDRQNVSQPIKSPTMAVTKRGRSKTMSMSTRSQAKEQSKPDISPNKDQDEHGTMRVVRSGSTTQETNKLLVSGENYFSIHFSGCGKKKDHFFQLQRFLIDY